MTRDPKQAREFEELFARQLAAYDDESDALKLPKLSTLGNIFSFAAPVVGGIIDHFKNKYVFFYPLPEEDLMVPSQRQLEPAS